MKKKEKRQPPVRTGHDDRPEEGRRDKTRGGEAAAPDGVSGDWS